MGRGNLFSEGTYLLVVDTKITSAVSLISSQERSNEQ